LASRLKQIWLNRFLLKELTSKVLKMRYKSAALGVAWAIIPSIVLAGVFTLIFGVLLKSRAARHENFPLWLLVALVPWNFFAMTLGECSQAMIHNAPVIKKVYFPRELIVLSIVLANMLPLVCSLVVIGVFMLILGVAPPVLVLMLPVVVVVEVLFLAGLAMAVSALNVVYRDVQYIIQAVMVPWFFLSPIFYNRAAINVEMVKNDKPLLGNLILINPMAGVIESFRAVLLGGDAQLLWPLLISAGYAVVAFVLGSIIFIRREKLFADYL